MNIMIYSKILALKQISRLPLQRYSSKLDLIFQGSLTAGRIN